MFNSRYLVILLLCFTVGVGLNAQPLPDSVRAAFNGAKDDVQKGRILISYFDMNTDKNSLLPKLAALKTYFEAEKLPIMVDYVDLGISRQQSRGSEYGESLKELFRLLPKFEKRKDVYGIMVCNRHISYAYYAAADSGKTLYYDRITVAQALTVNSQNDIAVAYNNIAADMAEYGQFDSAYFYALRGVQVAERINNPILIAKTLSTMGEGYIARKKYDSALHYIRRSLPIAAIHSPMDHLYGLNDLAQLYYETHQNDSSIYYASAAVVLAGKIHLLNQLLRAYKYLYKSYKETGPIDSAYKYLQFSIAAQDSMYSAETTTQVQLVTFREQNREKEIQQQTTAFQNDIKIYGLMAGLLVFSVVGLLLYRNSQKEKNAKVLLQKKNETIERTLIQLTT
ncbi:MAG: tetratricopeptide repeat protein, partial [Chitinophagaceae bacterium]